MKRIYHRKLWEEIITEDEEKISQEIMRRNYHRKLSAIIYHHAKNVGIIGMLAYPKIKSSAKEGTVASPSLLEGNGLNYTQFGREASTDHPLGEGLG